MINLKQTTIFILFIFLVIHISAQKTYYLSASGAYLESEENASIKLNVEPLGDNQFQLLYALKEGEKWEKLKFLQMVTKVADTLYYMADNKKMREPWVRSVVSKSNNLYNIRQLDKNGKLEFECQALNVFPLEKNGLNTLFDRDGLPMSEEAYFRGKRITEKLLFNPVDSSLKITKEPQFPGGIEEYRKFIALNVRYPVRVMLAGDAGKAYVKFMIDENGVVKNVQIATISQNDLSKELLRVVKSMETVWQPAESNDKKIAVWYYATVRFVSLGRLN